jgi:hypothetical protein
MGDNIKMGVRDTGYEDGKGMFNHLKSSGITCFNNQ